MSSSMPVYFHFQVRGKVQPLAQMDVRNARSSLDDSVAIGGSHTSQISGNRQHI